MAVRELLRAEAPGTVVIQESYAASQRHWIADVLRRWSDEQELDLNVTIGGTLPAPGPSEREIVPDATTEVAERMLPGFGEAMRAYAQETTDLALIDRCLAGIRGRTLILNLPQGAGAAPLFLEAVVALVGPVIAHLQELPSAPLLDEAVSSAGVKSDVATEMQDAGQEDTAGTQRSGGWDPDEFAAFLRRRSGEKPSQG